MKESAHGITGILKNFSKFHGESFRDRGFRSRINPLCVERLKQTAYFVVHVARIGHGVSDFVT
jgi:hypothetical protein